jgi:phenylacetate-CoA ligase
LLRELPTWPSTVEQSLALQERQIRRLLRHAVQRVPFYRRLYADAGFAPDRFRSLEDLHRVPLTTRAQRQAAPDDDLIAEGVNKARLVRHRTSGSSGMPLNILKSPVEHALHNFLHWRMYRQLGTRVGDRRVSVALVKGQFKRSAIAEWLFPLEVLDVRLSRETILTRLREVRPDILIIGASTALWLAAAMSTRDEEVIRPRLVLSWGETSTPEMRADIASAFHAQVIDFYASFETRMIAVQCAATGLYHLFENMTAVEILRDGQPAREGEEGEVVVTPLWQFAMPFIRYRQADIARLGPSRCPCGAPLRTISEIQGRLLDRIPLSDGNSIHPYTVIRPVVLEMPWVKRFQLVQESASLLRVLLVGAERPEAAQLERTTRDLEALLEGQTQVRIELVDEIPLPPTGKYYPYVSLERQQAWRQQDPVRP